MAFREIALITNMPPKEHKWHNRKAALIRIITELLRDWLCQGEATPSCFLSVKGQIILTAASLPISTSWLQSHQSVEIMVNP